MYWALGSAPENEDYIMSIGDVIVLGIVAAAVILAAVRIYKKKNTCGCGCSGCTAGCDRNPVREKTSDRG